MDGVASYGKVYCECPLGVFDFDIKSPTVEHCNKNIVLFP